MQNDKFLLQKEEQTKFYKHVGKQIKRQRSALFLTQDDLAFVFNMSRVSITNIETGKQRLPLHILKAISDFLFIPLAQLVPNYDFGFKTRSELKDQKIKLAMNKIDGKSI